MLCRNHDPDVNSFQVNNGLSLAVASITDSWYKARNTLTHRQLGPISTATVEMSISAMNHGDRAGLGLLRELSAYIGVWRDGTTFSVNVVNNITLDSSGNTISVGTMVASASVTSSTIWFRVISDSTDAVHFATFWYSTDGMAFKQLGPLFSASTINYAFFEGQRFAIFNFGTLSLGGKITVNKFELAAGSYTGSAVVI